MATILETTTKAGTFRALVRALKAVGMAEMLDGPGPFTLFAPNDSAFAKLPLGAVDELVSDLPRLKEVLACHVVRGRHLALEVARQGELITLQGKRLRVQAKGGIKVDGVQIIQPDIVVENGVIHVTDGVIML